jgi:hypothetical protein
LYTVEYALQQDKLSATNFPNFSQQTFVLPLNGAQVHQRHAMLVL